MRSVFELQCIRIHVQVCAFLLLNGGIESIESNKIQNIDKLTLENLQNIPPQTLGKFERTMATNEKKPIIVRGWLAAKTDAIKMKCEFNEAMYQKWAVETLFRMRINLNEADVLITSRCLQFTWRK